MVVDKSVLELAGLLCMTSIVLYMMYIGSKGE
uniref:Uncharacterized protein n=1 Tax=Podoviridae sp. ctiuS14 TaxID=2827620 RepID=A0A8S5LM04_9CAUD|nr:MAG TPA: hypothetical protein [Podoviridae sp. ctiuS14]